MTVIENQAFKVRKRLFHGSTRYLGGDCSPILENNPFDLRRLLADFCVKTAFDLEKKGLFFAIKICPSMPRFFLGDSARILDLLKNIIHYGELYANDGGFVLDCKSEPVNDRKFIIKFVVISTGSGIPPNKISLIFEPHPTLQLAQEIPGPNLYVAKFIVGMMAGDLAVENTFGFGIRYTATIKINRSIISQATETSLI